MATPHYGSHGLLAPAAIYRPISFSTASVTNCRLVIGFYDDFVGSGTGAFWMATTTKLFRLDLAAAAGVARFTNFISNITALLTLIVLSNVDYTIDHKHMGAAY